MKPWRTAGIVPVLSGPTVDDYLYLLGKEKLDSSWGWFGGHAELEDGSIQETAAREAYEESMGLLGTIDELRDRLTQSVQQNSTFFMPLSPAEGLLLPDTFRRVNNYFSHCLLGCPEGYLEKTEMRWFSWAEIISLNWRIHPKAIDAIAHYRIRHLL